MEERTTARPRSLWGLLMLSLIALALVAVSAPRARRPQIEALDASPSPTLTRRVHRRSNAPSRLHRVYVPLVSLSQRTPAVSPLATFQTDAIEPTTPVATVTHTLSVPPTPSSTSTPMATATHTPRATATATAADTPTPSPTFTPTATATDTPTPYPTPDGQTRSVRIPILMYHYISVPPPDADIYRRDLSVTPANFEQQLRYLIDNGYTTITLKDLVYHLTLGYPLPERPVILTFDDGYRDNFLHAYRLLRRFDSVGTFFIVTGFIDENRSEYLTWGQVRVMHQGGMAFGSHSFTHPDLRGQSVDYLVWQILGSQQAIEERIGEAVRFFSYPAGSYDQQVIDVLRSAGFWAAVTTRPSDLHTSDGLFELDRIRVRGEDTLEQFAAKLEYDWDETSP